MANVGWRYESARHALAAQGIKTGRRYNFDASAFQESMRGLGFVRAGREVMPEYARALSGGAVQAGIAASPVVGEVATTVAPATAGVVQTPVVTEVAKKVGRKTVMTPVTTYKETPVSMSGQMFRRTFVQRPVEADVPQVTGFVGGVKRATPREFWKNLQGRVGAQVITPVRLPSGQVVNASDALAAQRLLVQYPGAVIAR